MKKITGKATALVLALALVVTSFSSTFAFASTKSVTGTVSDTSNDDIYLVNGDGAKTASLKDWIEPELDTKDHQDVDVNVDITAISHSSGDSLVKWDIDKPADGDAQLSVKSTSKTGTEVLSVLYESSYTNDDGDDVTVKARKNLTVHVLDADSIVIGKVYKDSGAVVTSPREGLDIEAPDTFAQTAGSTQQIGVYKVGKGTTSAKAVYSFVNVTTKDSGLTANDYNIAITGDDVYFQNAAALAAGSVSTPVTVVVGKKNATARDASISNITITVKKTDGVKPSTKSDDKYTLKTKIEKKVDISATALSAVTAFTVKKSSGKTVVKATSGTPTDTVIVTDAEVVFPTGTTAVVADEGSIKKISGTVGTLTINDDAAVGSVDVTGAVTVDGGKVGDIDATADVTVTSGKAGNIDTDGSAVVNGGTVGTIEADGSVNVKSTDEDTPVVVGKVKANDVTINSDEAKVTVAGVTVTAADAKINVIGSNVTVGAIDFDYYKDVALTLGDDGDGEFVGTIAAPINAVNGKIVTENEDTVATVTGTVNVDTISIASDSSLALTGSTTVDTIDGDGVLKIAAGSLYVTGSVSSTTLRLTDANLAVGTTVFKSDSDTVDVDDFNTYGFTLDKSVGTNVDTFKIKTLTLAGLQINKSSSKIAKGYSETFTASAYPAGTALPTGATVKWELDGNDDVFAVTTSGNTATVKVNSVDANFASENTATLTATLYDADGYVLDDYDAAEVKLTAIAVPEATSDTNANFSVAQGSKYTFKITSTTAPSFTLGTAGVFTSALTKQSGNDYFYTITAVGAVGKATGVFLNGNKLLVASVKAPVANFKSDTTTAIKVAAGKSYTYKITSATAPSFGFGTTGVFTVSGITKSGNDYFYKVTAVGKAGAATGVFVNGVKVNVATVG